MKLIPVLDLKDGVVVHARKGKRKQYRPINSPLCPSSNLYDVLNAFLSVHRFDTFYIADLNAITNQHDNHDRLIAEVASRFSSTEFWVDKGYQRYEDVKHYPENILPILGSECYRDENISELDAFQNRFILSLDYAGHNTLGAKRLFQRPDLWPESIIIMTLERVGSGLGPDLTKLQSFRDRYPDKNFIAAGGVRNIEDCLILNSAGINRALIATALHNGMIGHEQLTHLIDDS